MLINARSINNKQPPLICDLLMGEEEIDLVEQQEGETRSRFGCWHLPQAEGWAGLGCRWVPAGSWLQAIQLEPASHTRVLGVWV